MTVEIRATDNVHKKETSESTNIGRLFLEGRLFLVRRVQYNIERLIVIGSKSFTYSWYTIGEEHCGRRMIHVSNTLPLP